MWGSESGYMIIFYRLSKLSQAKFSILCDVILLVNLNLIKRSHSESPLAVPAAFASGRHPSDPGHVLRYAGKVTMATACPAHFIPTENSRQHPAHFSGISSTLLSLNKRPAAIAAAGVLFGGSPSRAEHTAGVERLTRFILVVAVGGNFKRPLDKSLPRLLSCRSGRLSRCSATQSTRCFRAARRPLVARLERLAGRRAGWICWTGLAARVSPKRYRWRFASSCSSGECGSWRQKNIRLSCSITPTSSSPHPHPTRLPSESSSGLTNEYRVAYRDNYIWYLWAHNLAHGTHDNITYLDL